MLRSALHATPSVPLPSCGQHRAGPCNLARLQTVAPSEPTSSNSSLDLHSYFEAACTAGMGGPVGDERDGGWWVAKGVVVSGKRAVVRNWPADGGWWSADVTSDGQPVAGGPWQDANGADRAIAWLEAARGTWRL
eukprot:15344806-Alexandrium_andersonii.AAC.1